ncbi:MAG: hypothetical protein ACR2H3_07120 [Acidimicrobiales bacterium]
MFGVVADVPQLELHYHFFMALAQAPEAEVQHVEIDRQVLTPQAFSVAASYVDRDRSARQRGVRRDEFERMLEDVQRDPSRRLSRTTSTG